MEINSVFASYVNIHLLFGQQSAHSEMSRSGISQGWKAEEKDRGLLA